MTDIKQKVLEKDNKFSLFVLGFRPFFLSAGIFSVLSMLVWTLVYGFALQAPLAGLPSIYWHAHEMLFGFTMAVMAGFLLTAVKNWTGQQTLQQTPLLILFCLWVGARVCMLLGVDFFIAAAILDISFNLFLFVAVLKPILKVKQWRQAGIISKLFLIVVLNTLFYLGLFGIVDKGMYWGIYGGLFILLAIVLTIGRRVLPFFIERGVGYPVQLKNSSFLDHSSLLLFLALTVSEVFFQNTAISSYLAMPLFIISCVRLYNWHTKAIWSVPLLWGIYSAFIIITGGFLMYALMPYVDVITRSLSLHAFTLGGFGLMTLSMMSRVTLGHTGRGVKQVSPWIVLAQWLILLGVFSRVVVPLFWQNLYLESVFMSQLLWITGFALFVLVNAPYLTQARVDGAEG